MLSTFLPIGPLYPKMQTVMLKQNFCQIYSSFTLCMEWDCRLSGKVLLLAQSSGSSVAKHKTLGWNHTLWGFQNNCKGAFLLRFFVHTARRVNVYIQWNDVLRQRHCMLPLPLKISISAS